MQIVAQWATARLTEQAIAQIINTSPRWMDEYLIYRELGHRSAFGEESVADLTELQLKLLSITHTYDVIQSSLNNYNSYEDGIQEEIPDKLRPYPTNLLRWFNDWTEKTRKFGGSSKKSKSSNSTANSPNRSVLDSSENDADGYAAYVQSMRQRKQQKG